MRGEPVTVSGVGQVVDSDLSSRAIFTNNMLNNCDTLGFHPQL